MPRLLGGRLGLAPLAVSVLLLASACDKVPLLAPGGTVISLFPTANTVPLNGEIEIVVTAIENGTASTPTTTSTPGTGGTPTTPTPTATSTSGSGTPVQNGTLITFTTTLGRIEPAEARTNNGQVRVRLIAGGQSGTATITAFSGGSSGKLENLKVGTAAAERVLLTATPQTLPPAGGAAEIAARVEDVNGAGIPGVGVTFTADVGTLSAGTATTDASGVAKVTLTTSAKSTVTANVAGKTATVAVSLNPRTGLTLTAPTTVITALQPAIFTVGVAATANIRNVTIDWGDGRDQNLGAISASTSVAHSYAEAGTYVVRATAVDSSNFQESVSTTVTVFAAQPPSVFVTATPSTASLNQTVRLVAQVSGNTSAIVKYTWNFDSGSSPPSPIETTSNQVNVRWTRDPGQKFISVTVTQASGPEGDGFGTVNVTATLTGGATAGKQ